MDILKFEFFGNNIDGEVGTIFIYDSECPIEFFNFYTKSFTKRERKQALLEGTYDKRDFQDNIENITVKNNVKNHHDVIRTIILWLNKYYPEGLAKSLILVVEGKIVYEFSHKQSL